MTPTRETALHTPRLLLLALPRSVMARRLETDDFRAVLEGPDGPLEVHFPPPWPGAALGLFRAQVPRLSGAGDPWGRVAVRRSDARAVGHLAGKGGPDARGRLELGYGFNPEVWGQGLATEAVSALTRHFSALPEVGEVWAATAVGNPASARVLEKSGFRETGTDHDPQRGPVRLWTWVEA